MSGGIDLWAFTETLNTNKYKLDADRSPPDKKGLSSEGGGQPPSSPPYPVSHREVFLITKDYRYLGTSKKPLKFDYVEVEIDHEIPYFVELPGKESCGEVKSYTVKCVDCGYDCIYVFGGCDSPRCFACHVAWSKKKAYDDALRIMAGLEREKNNCGELWHFVLSPPENAYMPVRDESYIDEILKECYEMCKREGIVGGCAIVHYGPELGKKGINKYLPRGKYRPHVHVMGFGSRPSGPWLNPRGEWVVKTLNYGKPVSRSFDFIRDGLHYQLSHAMRRKGKQSIRWFGQWSYRMCLGRREKLIALGLRKKWIERAERYCREIVCKCPKCGGDMVKNPIFDANGGNWVYLAVKPPP